MAKEKEAKVKRSTALKRRIQSEKRRLINRNFRSQVRTVVRHFEEMLTKGSSEEKQTSLQQVYSMMDKGVKRGVYKLNKASRTKARLAARLAKA